MPVVQCANFPGKEINSFDSKHFDERVSALLLSSERKCPSPGGIVCSTYRMQCSETLRSLFVQVVFTEKYLLPCGGTLNTIWLVVRNYSRASAPWSQQPSP
jgi:hypothetical protein